MLADLTGPGRASAVTPTFAAWSPCSPTARGEGASRHPYKDRDSTKGPQGPRQIWDWYPGLRTLAMPFPLLELTTPCAQVPVPDLSAQAIQGACEPNTPKPAREHREKPCGDMNF